MDAIFGSGKISPRKYEIISEKNILVPMSDGVNIDIDIFRPDSTEKNSRHSSARLDQQRR